MSTQMVLFHDLFQISSFYDSENDQNLYGKPTKKKKKNYTLQIVILDGYHL